ncbi:hypothetical protein [Macrococcus sp. DPC7161]|uniref:hypothetical protein n=1 Tax=Macrococcus sp. DPC7161 TaxID=2507060 RepID=UPI00100A495B|nr:hypothetical protein [Macrococcus sp. DPC7161]RXK19093.1 hypothetical protein ER639_01910 [Macrococcus sp. DPC7161]
MKSPRQQIYDLVFSRLIELGFTVYDKLPAEQVPYPFIVIKQGESDYQNRHKFNREMGISLVVDTWYLSDERGAHDEAMTRIEHSFFDFFLLDGYSVKLREIRTSELVDRTTNDELLHGTIKVSYTVN